jgi:REP element-mobilizing transposase RayT
MATNLKSNLPRLSREWYQGRAVVLWTSAMEDRATGWLTETFHLHFRELLTHVGTRYGLLCPAYVLMPDHWHIVWMGTSAGSDQRLASACLRQHVRRHVAPAVLQDRPHDHVLREEERERGSFEATCTYVRENPMRADLAHDWRDWRYAGALVPGYPNFDPRDADFWDRFWRVCAKVVERA